MRPAYGLGKQLPRGVPACPVRERDPEGDGQVLQPVAPVVAHLLGVDLHLEDIRLRPPRRQRGDVDGCARADRGEQQLGRVNDSSGPVPDGQRATAHVAGSEGAGVVAGHGDGAMRGSSHGARLPDRTTGGQQVLSAAWTYSPETT